MTDCELQQQLPRWQQPPRPHSSDGTLFAYARVHAALHRLVSFTLSDAAWGTAREYREQLDALYRRFRRRYARRTAIAQRTALLIQMLRIVQEVDGAADRNKERTCRVLSDELIRNYLRDFRPEEAAPDEVSGILQLILLRLYACTFDVHAPEHPWLHFLHARTEEWINALDQGGSWPGITEREALQRLLVLDMKRYMLFDKRHDDALVRAYRHYCLSRQLQLTGEHPLTTEEIGTLLLMFDVIDRCSIGELGCARLSQQIAHTLERQSEQFPDTETALCCRSIVLEAGCRRLAAEALPPIAATR